MNSDHLGVLSWESAQPKRVSRVLVYWSGLKDSLHISWGGRNSRWRITAREENKNDLGAPRWCSMELWSQERGV